MKGLMLSCGTLLLLCLSTGNAQAQKVDYSVVSVPEESGTEFTQISLSTDYVCMPEVRRSARGIGWFSNRILDIPKDGSQIAYLSQRGNKEGKANIWRMTFNHR